MYDVMQQIIDETGMSSDDAYSMIDMVTEHGCDETMFHAEQPADEEYAAGGTSLEATNLMILDLAA
jgi:hypothetical protein